MRKLARVHAAYNLIVIGSAIAVLVLPEMSGSSGLR